MNVSICFRSLAAFLTAAWLSHVSILAEAPPKFTPYTRPVIVWVPPYATAKTKARLREQPPEGDPAHALSHVALQFWVPTASGEVQVAKRYDRLTDEEIAGWREWAHAHGLRVLLCLYNGEFHWDWPLARNAFAQQPAALVASLLSELERHQLDGIDLDLEGNGEFESDKPAFLGFVQALSTELHARHKQIFVDSFAYIWNAPNQRWWPELFPLVEGINCMGYEETGSRSGGWRGYAAQVTAAGADSAKLLIGLPTHLDRWQETSALEHLAWLATHPPVGVALWDAQFIGPAWKSPEVWARLRTVRDGK